jgi:hypothetical protein
MKGSRSYVVQYHITGQDRTTRERTRRDFHVPKDISAPLCSDESVVH